MKKKVNVSKRDWLNPKSSSHTGSMSFRIDSLEDNSWVDASVSIADCNRKITLSFDFWDDKSAKDAAQKLNLLISNLLEFQKHLGDAYIIAQEAQDETSYYHIGD